MRKIKSRVFEWFSLKIRRKKTIIAKWIFFGILEHLSKIIFPAGVVHDGYFHRRKFRPLLAGRLRHRTHQDLSPRSIPFHRATSPRLSQATPPQSYVHRFPRRSADSALSRTEILAFRVGPIRLVGLFSRGQPLSRVDAVPLFGLCRAARVETQPAGDASGSGADARLPGAGVLGLDQFAAGAGGSAEVWLVVEWILGDAAAGRVLGPAEDAAQFSGRLSPDAHSHQRVESPRWVCQVLAAAHSGFFAAVSRSAVPRGCGSGPAQSETGKTSSHVFFCRLIDWLIGWLLYWFTDWLID